MKYCCRVCGCEGEHPEYRCSEKMFGSGGDFRYFRCPSCGCLQIAQVPEDLAGYYPSNYYSYRLGPLPQRGVKAWLAGRRDRSVLLAGGGFGRWLSSRFAARLEVQALGRLPLKRGMRVLDVGCGRGQLLSVLWRAGFKRVTGADPYLASDIEVLPGLWVRKRSLAEIDDRFDVIMLHHVLEHVQDGLGTLMECRARLDDAGSVLVRIPTVEGEAWKHYGINWVGLDAPRHLFLHSRRSFEHLANKARLKLVAWWCEPAGFDYWASELYQRGLSLIDGGGKPVRPEDHFSADQLRGFDEQSETDCRAGRGDQVGIILKKE